MRRTPWRAWLLVLVGSFVVIACDGPNRGSRTQPSSASGFNIVVTASPNTVRGRTTGSGSAFGGCATVEAKVFDVNGNLIDGATVSLTTTLGIFRVGTDSFVGVTGTTVRGFIRFTYCSLDERGTSTITASVEDAFATTVITII